MTRDEEVQAALAAAHADKVAARLEAKGDAHGGAILRMFGSALRAGAHVKQLEGEAARALGASAIVADLIKTYGG